jgi:gliding motility-associated protein GldE
VNGTKIIQKRARKHGIIISSDELEQAIALTKEEHTSEEEHKILEGIIRFGSTECCQIMCPRLDIVALKETQSFKEVLKVIQENGYSRVPVYKDSVDNVIGILYIKDLLPHLDQSEEFEWNTLLRKPMFVPENKKIDDLLKDFQEVKMHMAVVVDEYGGASGIITLDDILEEIVGDITDEYDVADVVYTKIDDHTFLFEGRTSLVDFYKVLDIDGREFDAMKGESETLGGFIVENAERILRNNEFITVGPIKLIVDSSDKRRIKLVKAIVPKED